MFDVGYWLSSEEHQPRQLVEHAVQAEADGFRSVMISDHFHPWIPAQGSAPFVWGVIGAIAHATSELHVATGVTAPILRMHPAIVAQAAATAAVQLDGRFALGVGTGERLNEHVVGGSFARPGVRRRMLEEALVDVIQPLLRGEVVDHEGEHFAVEHARLFTLPASPPPVWLAAGGVRGARLAGRIGDGLISVEPNPVLVDAFATAGGTGPRVAQLHVCVADDADEARSVAHHWWPVAAVPPALRTELARPDDLAAASALVTPDAVAQTVLCEPDAEAHLSRLARFAAAGFDRVYVHAVGPDQQPFFDLYAKEVLPALRSSADAR